MAANPKPSNTTDLPDWGESADPANMVSVPPPKRLLGWVIGERPASAYFNWLFRCYGRWIAYLDTFEQNAYTWALKQTFTLGADMNAKLRVLAGGAEVTGNSTVTGTLGVSSNATVGGTLGVTGATTLSTLQTSQTATTLAGFIADFQGAEATPGFFYKAATAARSLAARLTITSGMACRFLVVSPNKLIVTINAKWNGTGWNADTPGTASLWMGLSPTGFEVKTYTAPDVSAFADAAFTAGVTFNGGGTKGQVLGYTADGTASFTNTLRYAEMLLTDPGAPSLTGVFASATRVNTGFYRSVTGRGGLMGAITMTDFSAVSNAEQGLFVLPNSPINYRPSQDSHCAVMARQAGVGSGVPFAVKCGVYTDGNVTIEGIKNVGGTGAIWFDSAMFRTTG